MTRKNKSIISNFNYILKDFESDKDPQKVWYKDELGLRSIKEYKIELPPELIITHPFIIFIIFVYIKKYNFSGKWEKIAWTIPIKYKNKSYLLTHRKFGFHIISNEDGKEITESAIEAMEKIKKAIPLAELLFEPHIKDKVNLGQFSLTNEFFEIKKKYAFFRLKAEEEYGNLKKSNRGSKRNSSLKTFIEIFEQQNRNTKSAEYNASAMLDAYFSLLEHTLVLLVPFIKQLNYSSINIEEFIAKNWKEKYKIIFPVINDRTAFQQMEALSKIKEAFRNPLSHGYFFKNGDSFKVHVKHLGALPVTLTKSKDNITYSTIQIGHYTFSEICKIFDLFDKYLHTNSYTKYGMLYINSGLPVAYTPALSEMYKAYMTSVKKFNQFIEHESFLHDDAANMDW